MSFIKNRAGLVRGTPPEDAAFMPSSAAFSIGDDSNFGAGEGGDRRRTSDNYSFQPASSSTQAHASPPITAKEDPIAGAVFGIVDVTTKMMIVHPCTVLRRQGQVHQFARCLHLTPVTLVPVVCNMVAKEGLPTLWRGSIGTCVVWGLSNVVEIVLSDVLGLPKTVVKNGSREKYWKHLILKAATYFMMTPFYISSFTETVKSGSGLAGDDNRVTDVLVKAVDRMRYAVWGARDASKRFSVLHLAMPTVGFRMSHYLIQSFMYQQFYGMARRYLNKKPESEKTKFHQYLPQIFAQISSSVVTDLILFPIETVLHRMYIQGTRTLIDNLDTGLSAVSITVKYNGFFDCLTSIVQREGFTALYSGVGALALEYLLQTFLQQLVRACFDRGSEVLRKATANTIVTPPLSTSTSYAGPLSGPISNQGPLSGPFHQSLSPINSPRKITPMPMVTTPPRDPTQFPTFGESVSQMNSPFGPPPPFHSNRPNIFGSPPNRERDRPSGSPLPPIFLNTNDPFSG